MAIEIFLIIDYGNQKLAIEKISSCNSVTRKLNIWSPILWQSNLFLITIHNGGSSSVMNFLCVLVPQHTSILSIVITIIDSMICFLYCFEALQGGLKVKTKRRGQSSPNYKACPRLQNSKPNALCN